MFIANIVLITFLIISLIPILKIKNSKLIITQVAIITALFIKVLTSYYFQNHSIYFISNFIIYSSYLLLVRLFTKIKVQDIIYLIINILLFVLFLINNSLNKLVFNNYYLNILLIANLLYIFINITAVTDDIFFVRIIIDNRYILFIPLIILESFKAYYINNSNAGNIIQLFFYLPISFIINRFGANYFDEQFRSIKIEKEKKNDLFDLINNISNNIKYPLEIKEITKTIIDAAAKITNASSGAFFIVEEESTSININSTMGNFPTPSILPIKVGETIFGESAKNGKAVFIKDAVNDKSIKESFTEKALITSIIIVPIIIEKTLFGIICIIKNIQKEYFNDDDLKFLKIFSEYTSASINNIYKIQDIIQRREIEREIEISTFIQKRLIYKSIPNIPNTSIAAFTNPARGISGDFIDIIKIDDDNIGVTICDVAGKSINAVSVLTVISALLKLCITIEKNPANVLRMINSNIAGTTSMDNYATIGFYIYNNKNNELIYSNAAHIPLIIFQKRSKKFLKIETNGLPIGIDRSSKYFQKRVKLEKGDIALMITDGIIEATNNKGEQFSIKSLQKIILENLKDNAEELAIKIKIALKIFLNNSTQRDDQTIVILKRNHK